MEIVDNTIDNENEIDTSIQLDKDRIELLRYRGFYSKTDKADDYYNDNRELLSLSFFQSDIRLLELFRMPYEKMKEQLFSKDSVIPQEVCFIDEKMWHSSFGGSKMFYDVRPDCLEPYISRYVRIINRCGMKTFYSCDGWHRASHKSREMVIIFEDRYSWIWHKIICEQLDYVKWEYGKRLVRISLPHHDSGKLCIYEKVNNAAELFENNCSYLKSLKRQVIDSIEDTSIYIDIYSDEEVEDIIRNAFITVFTGQK